MLARLYFQGQVLYVVTRPLRAFALKAFVVVWAVGTTVWPAFAPTPARASTTPAPVSVDSLITVTVAPALGSEAVTVEGKAPAMAPVILILHAMISKDLPTVFVNRRDVTADADGHFSTTVPIAADFWRGSILTVTASSESSVSSATAQTIVTLPNPGVVLPADDVPSH